MRMLNEQNEGVFKHNSESSQMFEVNKLVMSFVTSNVLLTSFEGYTCPGLSDWDQLVVVGHSYGTNMVPWDH